MRGCCGNGAVGIVGGGASPGTGSRLLINVRTAQAGWQGRRREGPNETCQRTN